MLSVKRNPADARSLPWYGWVALAILLTTESGALLDVFWIRRYFYQFAWCSYILIVDALTWRRSGQSLLRTAPREFTFLAFWSISLWCVFEVINFRLRNWAYINVPTPSFFDFCLGLLAFATVLPGVFETEALLAVCGVWSRGRCRPLRISHAVLLGSIALGAAMLVALLVVPRVAFPLTWGFAVFLCDPICYRWNRSGSLLAQWEAGDPSRFLRLLVAGLICGGLWEFWNYWAYTKWLYTVPGLDQLKWFEMPPLGFLGFPPFAVECYVLVNCLNIFRRGRGWEHPQGTGAPKIIALASVLFALIFNFAVYAGISRWAVISTAPAMADLAGVAADLVPKLEQAGLSTPPEFLKAITRRGIGAVAHETGATEQDVEQAVAAARLADLDGLGADNQRALWSLGIRSVSALAARDPDALFLDWQRAAEWPPSEALVRLWIRAARRST